MVKVVWSPKIWPIWSYLVSETRWISEAIWIYGHHPQDLWWSIYRSFSGCWFQPTPLKNDGVCQLGSWKFPSEWKNKTCSKPPTRYVWECLGWFHNDCKCHDMSWIYIYMYINIYIYIYYWQTYWCRNGGVDFMIYFPEFHRGSIGVTSVHL